MQLHNEFLINQVKSRLRNKQNFIALIAGSTGSGKSYLSMKIGELIDRNFNVDKIAYTVQELLEQVRIGQEGECLVLDESGVAFGSRRAMSRDNVILSNVLETFRFKSLALLLCVPDLGQVDINARRLAHVFIETKQIDYEHQLLIVKWFNIHVDRWSGEILHKYPRVMIPRKGIYIINEVSFTRPSKRLREAYEIKKKGAFEDLLEQCETMIDEANEKKTTQDNKRREKKAVVDSPVQDTSIVSKDMMAQRVKKYG